MADRSSLAHSMCWVEVKAHELHFCSVRVNVVVWPSCQCETSTHRTIMALASAYQYTSTRKEFAFSFTFDFVTLLADCDHLQMLCVQNMSKNKSSEAKIRIPHVLVHKYRNTVGWQTATTCHNDVLAQSCFRTGKLLGKARKNDVYYRVLQRSRNGLLTLSNHAKAFGPAAINTLHYNVV